MSILVEPRQGYELDVRRQTCASFNGQHVDVHCNTDWLASELQQRFAHLAPVWKPVHPPLLSVFVDELAPTWFEVRDSAGRRKRGSFDRVVSFAGKWVVSAFVAANPDLLWVHASAAALNGYSLLLCGAAGSGKSTLVVKLLERGWSLLGDD